MTIYVITLTSEQLDKFPAPQYTINLCMQLCEHILLHCKEILLSDDPAGQKEAECQITIMKWYFNMLKKSTANDIAVDPIIKVHSVGLVTKANISAPIFKKLITMDDLCKIHPKILMGFLDQLIKNSLTSLTPYLVTAPHDSVTVCVETLELIPGNLSKYIDKYLDKINANIIYSEQLEFDSIQITLEEINCKENEMIFLT